MGEIKYICTSCGGDAFMAYVPKMRKRKGELIWDEIGSWNGLVKPNERICLSCGKKRGINFF